MKAIVLVLFLLGFTTFAKADQLAYISKEEAEKAAEFIRSQKFIYLFCGCCENDTPKKIKPVSVEVRYTNYDNYYEVVVTYAGENGTQTEELDLAYTWVKKRKKMSTVGTMLNMSHDPCNPYPKK